ncbi:MAG: hypothetical protein A4E57_04040 [Syntrophorhabdaceae bacterium PtaU1.Bin034]|nr:MAG: hypothetical protein A4E57_04040 [Syntrophorhabdaceae bacterium PtaU1.Bin034]
MAKTALKTRKTTAETEKGKAEKPAASKVEAAGKTEQEKAAKAPKAAKSTAKTTPKTAQKPAPKAEKTRPAKAAAKSEPKSAKAAAKPAAPKTPKKAPANRGKAEAEKVSRGDQLYCETCGLVVSVDEECGCTTCDIICCGEQMQPRE